MASANDFFHKVGRSTATTLSSPGYTTGDTSINVASTTNWPSDTGVTFAIDEVDGDGLRVANSYNVFRGNVAGGTQIAEVVYVGGDANRNYSAGVTTRVYILVSSFRDNRFTDGILEEHNQDGTHGDITADSIKVAGNVQAQSFTITGSGGNQGWETGLPTPNTVTYNGNRSYDLVFNSTDLTDTLSPGMRLRTTRTVTAPTQCTDLESSSSQYWQDTSVSGITFTDDFVAGAWVKLESYPGTQTVISRYNGTSGWYLEILSDGRFRLVGNNGGSGNYSFVQSYQSLPLNKWVHIAAQLDMSTFTATPTTSYTMIDGVDAPAQVIRAGTNPTALVQAGNLQVGASNSTNFFDGKIAQAFVSSAKITQANVRTIISQGLTASLISTHSIASAYDFNNNSNDLNTTNANDLTASGSATATNADSPFALGNDLASAYTKGTTDFGVVMATSFSTNTTVTVQVPEGCTIPTSGGVTSVVYSGQRSPYGFPSNRNLWTVECIDKYQAIQSSPTASTWYYTNLMLTTPIGAWKLGYELLSFGGKTASVFDHYVTLATSSATETSNAYTSVVIGYDTISSMQSRTGAVSLSSATPYYVNMKTSSSGVNNIQIVGIATYATGRIYAENAYV